MKLTCVLIFLVQSICVIVATRWIELPGQCPTDLISQDEYDKNDLVGDLIILATTHKGLLPYNSLIREVYPISEVTLAARDKIQYVGSDKPVIDYYMNFTVDPESAGRFKIEMEDVTTGEHTQFIGVLLGTYYEGTTAVQFGSICQNMNKSTRRDIFLMWSKKPIVRTPAMFIKLDEILEANPALEEIVEYLQNGPRKIVERLTTRKKTFVYYKAILFE